MHRRTEEDVKYSSIVCQNTKLQREEIHKWSKAKLSRELANLGVYLDPDSISAIERGRYSDDGYVSVVVDDFMAFVVTFVTSPSCMLLPLEKPWENVIRSEPLPWEGTSNSRFYSQRASRHIKRCRKAKGLSQVKLAKMVTDRGLKISNQRVRSAEQDRKSRGISIDLLMYLAMVLGDESVSPEKTVENWLLTEPQ